MRVVALLLSAALLMPIAWAGTPDDPEITDAAADVSTSGGAPACPPTECQSAPRFIDLVKVWAEPTADKMLFRIQVFGNHNANAYGAAEYMVFFSVGGDAYEAGLLAGRSSTTGGDDSQTAVGVADAASFQEDHVLVEVPLAAIGTGVLTDFYARTTLDLADESDDSLIDRAPDTGFGADVVIEGAEERAMVHQNVTGDLDHAFATNQSADASFLINWTGPAHATMELRVDGNGSVDVTLLDPAGVRQFACACNGTTNETAAFEAQEGVWRVELNYTAFAGASSLRLYETPQENATQPPGNATGETGNETSAPRDNGAPLPVAPLVLAVLTAAALRRRR